MTQVYTWFTSKDRQDKVQPDNTPVDPNVKSDAGEESI